MQCLDLAAAVQLRLDRLAPIGGSIADLVIRIAVFRIFFWSGLVKVDDWVGTLQLFQYEYMVPMLPVWLAAALAAAFELGASSLVLVGLATRLAALPLLGMSCIIQFVLGGRNPAYDQLEHYLWMALLLSPILHGPGRFSLDALLAQRLKTAV